MTVKQGNIVNTNWNEVLRNRMEEQARSAITNTKPWSGGHKHGQPSINPRHRGLAHATAAARQNAQERINVAGLNPAAVSSLQSSPAVGRLQSSPAASAPAASSAAKDGSTPTVQTAPRANVPAQSGPYKGTGTDNPWNAKFGDTAIASGDIKGQNWYGDSTVGAAVQQLASDPQQINYNWAREMGYGQGVEGLLNRHVDPYAMAMLSGMNPGPNTEYLDYVGGFNANAMKNVNDSVQFQPRQIVQRVLSATGDVNTDPNVKGQAPDQVGQMLYGGANATNPAGQIDSTLKFLESSLTGLMSDVALESLLSLYAQQGREFLRFKMTEGGAPSAINFGGWLMDRFGESGGL